MNPVREMHNKAMDFAEQAYAAKVQGDMESFNKFSLQAYELEAQAAGMVAPDLSAEPTRSVLHRSAASLALDCKKYSEALRLIEVGLGGRPPFEIAEELRDLFEQASFFRHLSLRGVSLETNELQFTIAGPNVGFGLTPSEQFVGRLQSLQKIIYRVVDRLSNQPFQERGGPGKSTKIYDLFLSAPRPGSFAISLHLGTPEQKQLPGFEEPSPVIEEVLKCIELFNSSQDEALRARIGDDAYYRNFVVLARDIAPDEENVTSVGFTAVGNEGAVKEVSLRRPQKNISLIPKNPVSQVPTDDGKIVVVKGTLRFAEASEDGLGRIRVEDEKGKRTLVTVPEGLSDLVKLHWEENVEVTGTRINRSHIKLVDVKRLEV